MLIGLQRNSADTPAVPRLVIFRIGRGKRSGHSFFRQHVTQEKQGAYHFCHNFPFCAHFKQFLHAPALCMELNALYLFSFF